MSAEADALDDGQRLRYSRHLLLDEWSEGAQSRLLASHALVIGAGGLGAPALLYLASAGVGRLTVVDPDAVEVSNLQRQIVHTTERVGWSKVASAQAGLAALNPQVEVRAIPQAVDEPLLAALLPDVAVVLDCTDRFATRHLINRACWAAGVPLVSASAIRFDGQISVFDARRPQSPCYACLFPPDAPPQETSCALMGVFAPLVGMMGVMQAGEALKLLVDLHEHPGQESLAGRLFMLDARDWHVTTLRAQRDPACSVCGTAQKQTP